MAAERAQHADLFHATPGAQVDLFRHRSQARAAARSALDVTNRDD
jgi:hypothetical protein